MRHRLHRIFATGSIRVRHSRAESQFHRHRTWGRRRLRGESCPWWKDDAALGRHRKERSHGKGARIVSVHPDHTLSGPNQQPSNSGAGLAGSCLLAQRMKVENRLLKPVFHHMGIDLSGGNVGMAEQRLQDTQVHSPIEEMAREGMAQHVG